MRYCTIMLAVISLLGLTALGTNQALAWGGDGHWGHQWFNRGYWGHWNEGGSCCDSDQGNPCCGIAGIGSDGYNAGIADAIYDHQNGLAYNPIGNCLSCHSPDYWNNFRQGYQHQWDNYQNTQQTVNNYVTVNGNGNDVRLDNGQSSDQLGSSGPSFQQPEGSWNGP